MPSSRRGMNSRAKDRLKHLEVERAHEGKLKAMLGSKLVESGEDVDLIMNSENVTGHARGIMMLEQTQSVIDKWGEGCAVQAKWNRVSVLLLQLRMKVALAVFIEDIVRGRSMGIQGFESNRRRAHRVAGSILLMDIAA